MSTRSARNLPARLEGTRRRLDRWRRTRKGRSRIPEKLWKAAVRAAGKYGLAWTSRVLRLDYYALKKRVEAAACRRASDREGVTAFVELAPAPPTGSPECLL